MYKSAPGKIPANAEAATRATCKAFHLAYYRGKGGSLTKVDTRIQLYVQSNAPDVR